MNTFSLCIYRIKIYKRLKKEETVILSDYDNGKSFLNQCDALFQSWKADPDNVLYKDIKAQKVSRIQKDAQGNEIYYKHANCIDGIIESGDYGTQEDIVNIDTGEFQYTKTLQDATLVPFYFMIYVLPHSSEGYLIVERIGNFGIFGLLKTAIANFIGPQLTDNYTLSIEPYLVPQILKIRLNAVGGAKKVRLKGVDKNQFKDLKTEQNFGECSTEVVFAAPKNKPILDILPIIRKLREAKERGESIRVNNIECVDVAFELDINGKSRTVTVADMKSIGMNLDITQQVEFGPTHYPTYECLNREAHTILSYLMEGNNDEEA